ncbi:hypothetical protein CLAIMM_12284 [Cladophialophora immunda]|nr:hypothetical protein CLAIMM_12284 [Cladophialophora immunda]
MVSLADVLLNNTSLLTPGSGPVCALVGCTEGIGQATLHAVLRHTSSPTIYVVGRGGPGGVDTTIAAAQGLNESATLIPITAEDLGRVSCAQDAARAIVASAPPRLDLLIITAPSSPGHAFLSLGRWRRASRDFPPAEDSLDRAACVRYLARMRILITLLPLLRKAASPRVACVVVGGGEGTLPLLLPPLEATADAVTTLFFEHVARQPGNDKIVFLQISPGLAFPGSSNAALLPFLWDWVLTPIFRLVGYTLAEEAGERVLFAATNGRFRRIQDPERAKGTLIQQGSDGVLGSGVYLVNADSSVVEGGRDKELKRLRSGMDAEQKTWEYTMGELARIGGDGQD